MKKKIRKMKKAKKKSIMSKWMIVSQMPKSWSMMSCKRSTIFSACRYIQDLKLTKRMKIRASKLIHFKKTPILLKML